MRNRVPHQVERAIAHFGTAAEMARKLGVDADFIRQWRNGTKQVPAIWCARIEVETGREVTRRDLRPADYWLIWPDLKAPKNAKAA